MSKIKHLQDQLAAANAAMQLRELGMKVVVTPFIGEEFSAKLKSLPWQRGDGTWAVDLHGVAGSYTCSCVRPAE